MIYICSCILRIRKGKRRFYNADRNRHYRLVAVIAIIAAR